MLPDHVKSKACRLGGKPGTHDGFALTVVSGIVTPRALGSHVQLLHNSGHPSCWPSRVCPPGYPPIICYATADYRLYALTSLPGTL